GKFLRIDYAMLPNCEWNQKQKPLAVSRRKTPDEKMISWKKAESNLQKRCCMVGTRYFASATNY
ncbi:MAG: hypothetical protein PUI32_06925, partial [Bacteroidales bacterium]|nr:hypothetical protein [Bacteroidales bacterium]MDY5206756.1 hypothetical protein [Sodaliphilus sp.]